VTDGSPTDDEAGRVSPLPDPGAAFGSRRSPPVGSGRSVGDPEPPPQPSPSPYDTGAPRYAPSGVAPGTNGFAIASLVTGIVGFFCLVPAVLALVFGYKARNQIALTGGVQSGRGMATTGIVLGWIWIGLTALYFLTVLFFVF
jgi:hypothetical protein